MKKIITMILLAFMSNCLYSQTIPVGTGQTYPTLKSVFDDINNGTITGNIVLEITSSITETSLAVLNASGNGFASYNSVLIYPNAAGYIINSVTNTGGLISFNGADHVTIDGRPNMTGSDADLTLEFNFPNQPASTISFNNKSEHNVVQYCNVHVSPPNASNGAVKFSGNVDPANSSAYNKISHNNFRYTMPIGGLQLVIFLVNEHSDTVENNNFINYMFQYTVPLDGNAAAIRMINGCYDNVVKGNSFYNTANFQPMQSTNSCAIYSQGPTNQNNIPNTIIDNYIGGTAPHCGGSPLTITSVNANDKIGFIGICAQGGNVPYEMSGNTITNISIVNNKMDVAAFYGIYHYSGAGNIMNNTIGAPTGNGSVSIQNSNNSCDNYGIYMAANSFPYVHDNVIGSITCTNTSPTYYINFTGIQKSGSAGYVRIEKNLIGSETTAASIQANSTGESWQALKGIYCTNSDSVLISENTISNLYNNCTKTDNANEGGVIGIHTTFNVNARIKRNIIKNISCNSASISTTIGPVTGIYNAGSGSNLFQEIEGNAIYNLEATNTSAANTLAKGISINFGNGNLGDYTIKNNFIHSIVTNSTGTLSMAEGIAIHNGYITIANNIISLGTTSRRAYGVHQYQTAGSSTVYLYHNTIYLAGLPSDFESAAFRKATPNPTGTFMNNLFFNNKANASGIQLRHFAFITLASILSNSIDYNNYYTPNTGGATGRYLGTDKPTLTDWQATTVQDVNSLNQDPVFNLAGGVNAVDYYPNTPMPALPIAGISTDLFRNNRTGYWMGALETNVPLPVIYKSFTAQLSTDNTVCLTWITSSEYNSSHFEIERSHDAKSWHKINTVSAQGNSQAETRYNATDRESFTGHMYYRIKQTDMDGKYNYSTVEKVNRTNLNEISIYPNPCTMTLNIIMPQNAESSTIEIYAMDGQKIMTEQTNQAAYKINVNSLTKGTYMLRVLSSEKTFTTKFVRQ